jgi:hypothetical protein
MSRASRLSLLAAAAALVACNPPRPASNSDELTIVVQADRRELEQQEKALRQREDSLKAEQGELDKRIQELAQGRVAADLDHRRRLDDELRRARAEQDALGRRVQQLHVQKAAVEQQRTQLTSPEERPGATPAMREAMIAAREAKLSAREGSLAAREAELAAREKALAVKEMQILDRALMQRAAPQVVNAVAREPASAREVPSRGSVEARHRKLLAELESRGVLVSDLRPEDQPLNAEIYGARRVGDYARAADLLGELHRAVGRLRIDQRFVEQKMVRLQGRRANAHLPDGQRGEVEQILRDVTASYSDGKYDQANRGLNRLAAILDASGASG